MKSFRYYRFVVVAVMTLILDQWTKFLVIEYIPKNCYFHPVTIIKDFLYFVHIYNPGAAWGLFSGQSILLAILAVLAIVGILLCKESILLYKKTVQYAFGLFCGGILGNLIDRIRFSSVLDFIDVHLPYYRWPAFNLADSAICIGVIIYAFFNLKRER